MTDQPHNGIEELRARLADRDALQRQLTEAREMLDREVYRLDTIEIRLDMAQADIRELESLSLMGIMTSLLGTKAGKLDARREECDMLDREQKECARAIETLKQQVAQLTGEVAVFGNVEAELQALYAEAGVHGIDEADAEGSGSKVTDAKARPRLERAMEAGESLLNHLDGMFKLCTHLRRGPNTFRGGGALVSAAVRSYKRHVANGVTSQIAGSVRHFCNQLQQLPLEPENPSDAEIIASLAQLERFADPASPTLGDETDSWAELEVLARRLVSDLQERLGR